MMGAIVGFAVLLAFCIGFVSGVGWFWIVEKGGKDEKDRDIACGSPDRQARNDSV